MDENLRQRAAKRPPDSAVRLLEPRSPTIRAGAAMMAMVLGLACPARADTTGGSFEELFPSSLGGDLLVVTGASQYGATVVGFGDIPPSVEAAAFRFVGFDEEPALELLSPLAPRSYARAVTFDGALIVGQVETDEGMQAVVWDESGSLALPPLLAGADCDARDISFYGAIIVGVCDVDATGAHMAVVWWRVGADWEVEPLGEEGTEARAISGDSAVIVGATAGYAAVWRLGVGGYRLEELPAVPEGIAAAGTSVAVAVSSDGATVVGTSTLDGSGATLAWRWLVGSGHMEWLGTLSGNDPIAGDVADEVVAANQDGTLIVGRSGTASESVAFVWSEGTGILDLQAVLESDEGKTEQLKGWKLSRASCFAPDDFRVYGEGTRDGEARVWSTFLLPWTLSPPPVDEPDESEEPPEGAGDEASPADTREAAPEVAPEATPEATEDAAAEAAAETTPDAAVEGDAGSDVADPAVELESRSGGSDGCGTASRGAWVSALAFLLLLRRSAVGLERSKRSSIARG